MGSWRVRRCPQCGEYKLTANGHAWCEDCKQRGADSLMKNVVAHLKKKEAE